MTRLPASPHLQTPGMQAVFSALGAADGDSRLVGGAVRDALLGLDVSDIDIATRLSPEEASKRLSAAGIKVVPTGIAHGTVTAVTPDGIAEVTTLRRDVTTDGRRAVVAYTGDWREDAIRRDFTINALYANPLTGEIFDDVGGLPDLDARRVRFIGSPAARIAEDHLRILRFFRFHARFGRGELDADGLAACAARANDLMALSRERIRDELFKLLCVADPVPTVRVMIEHGILKAVLPEITDAAALDALIALEARLGLPCVAIRRLAALLPADVSVLDSLGARLRLSNVERKRLAETADRRLGDLRALAYRVGRESAIDKLLLAGRDDLAALDGWTPPRMPVSGKDLIALGIPPGPEVSQALHKLEQSWIEAGFPADRDAVLALAQPPLRR